MPVEVDIAVLIVVVSVQVQVLDSWRGIVSYTILLRSVTL